MLHASLIVHYHVRVMALELLNLCLHQTIDKTIASLSLGAPHNHKVKIIFFDNGVCHPNLQPCLFCHPGRNLIAVIHSRPLNFFPQLSKSSAYFHAEHFIQIGIGIRIHSQHRLFPMLTQILNHQSAQSRLTHTAFSGHCNDMSHIVTSNIF